MSNGTGGRRAGAAALVALAVALGAAFDAGAQANRAENELRLQRMLGAVCADAARTEGGSCAVRLVDGALVLRRELQRNGVVRTGRLRETIGEPVWFEDERRVAFDDRSHFFCSRADADANGRSALYVSCSFDEGARGRACVLDTRRAFWPTGPILEEESALSIALLARADHSSCKELAHLLNGLLDGPRAGADPYLRDPG